MSLIYSSFVPEHRSEIGDAEAVGSSEGAAQRLTLALVGGPDSGSWFERHDGPTLLVAVAIYASWLLLLGLHEFVP